MNKILIIGPHLNMPGGVAQYYNYCYSDEELTNHTDYLAIGKNKASRHNNFKDIFRFIKKIFQYKQFHFNPSMELKSILRETLLGLIVLIFGKKYYISMMGWNDNAFEKIIKNKLLFLVVGFVMKKAVAITVPSNYIRKKMLLLCDQKKITLLNPPYDASQDHYEYKEKKFENQLNVLFLARIEKSKGIYTCLDIIEAIQAKDDKTFNFTIAGVGSEFEYVKNIIQMKNLNINLMNGIYGEEKNRLYDDTHLFLYPSKHAEGFPLVLAEAMRAGLVLVSSNSGGIKDRLSENNGFIFNENAPVNEYIHALIKIKNKRNYLSNISHYNIEFSKKEFSPHSISSKILQLYRI